MERNRINRKALTFTTIFLCGTVFLIKNHSLLGNPPFSPTVDLDSQKKEKIPYPICSVVAVFKMLVRILNTLRSRIWDRVFFLFSDYPNLQLVRMGIAQKAMVFIRMNISRRRYFLTRLYKNYIYLLLLYGEFFSG